jgi:hypothetical protein
LPVNERRNHVGDRFGERSKNLQVRLPGKGYDNLRTFPIERRHQAGSEGLPRRERIQAVSRPEK